MFTFTREQSSAIAAIEVTSNNEVNIAYQSNPDRFYTFTASEDIITEIEERAAKVLMNVPMLSMGRFIAEIIKDGSLKQVELTAV